VPAGTSAKAWRQRYQACSRPALRGDRASHRSRRKSWRDSTRPCRISVGAARQSTSVLICLGLAHAPSFVRAICSIPSFGIANSPRRFALSIPAKIPAKKSAAAGASANFHQRFQMRRSNSTEKSGIEPWLQVIDIANVLYLVPLADNQLVA
jgi:hypothetical protein